MATPTEVLPTAAEKSDVAEKVETVGSSSASSNDPLDEEAERKAFLATFTAEEDKAIRRKVDWRFLWLIGLIYIIKNVRLFSPRPSTHTMA
jgi:hypothetical protein